MLTLLDFAKLSLHVYKNQAEIKKYLGGYVKTNYPMSVKELFRRDHTDGIYEVLIDQAIQNHHAQTHSSDNFGFHASFYVKKHHNKITDAVIAIRGTDNIQNDVADIKSWWRSVMVDGQPSLPNHYNQMALAFYYKAREFRLEHDIPYHRFFVTGHSLGGALAGLLAAHDGAIVRAVTFNAPGIADMKRVKHGHNLVINFRSAFDFVSAIDKPIGNLFPIHVPEKEAEAKKAFEIEYEHKESSWSRLDIIEDLVEIEEFMVSVLPQHKMRNLYQAIERRCHHKEGENAYLDPHGTFDHYERQLILPAPFGQTLYPGEDAEEGWNGENKLFR